MRTLNAAAHGPSLGHFSPDSGFFRLDSPHHVKFQHVLHSETAVVIEGSPDAFQAAAVRLLRIQLSNKAREVDSNGICTTASLEFNFSCLYPKQVMTDKKLTVREACGPRGGAAVKCCAGASRAVA